MPTQTQQSDLTKLCRSASEKLSLLKKKRESVSVLRTNALKTRGNWRFGSLISTDFHLTMSNLPKGPKTSSLADRLMCNSIIENHKKKSQLAAMRPLRRILLILLPNSQEENSIRGNTASKINTSHIEIGRWRATLKARKRGKVKSGGRKDKA